MGTRIYLHNANIPRQYNINLPHLKAKMTQYVKNIIFVFKVQNKLNKNLKLITNYFLSLSFYVYNKIYFLKSNIKYINHKYFTKCLRLMIANLLSYLLLMYEVFYKIYLEHLLRIQQLSS